MQRYIYRSKGSGNTSSGTNRVGGGKRSKRATAGGDDEVQMVVKPRKSRRTYPMKKRELKAEPLPLQRVNEEDRSQGC